MLEPRVPARMRGSDVIAAPANHTAGAREPRRKTGEDVSPLFGDSAPWEGFVLRQVFHAMHTSTLYNCLTGGFLLFFYLAAVYNHFNKAVQRAMTAYKVQDL